ncbi:muscle M-line assembly protein unc-89-like, partial [Stylophora pistillata]|uniref:muscle M-line assembly protein unc-89-like n=1 Tax=Stylophora pistillata TaxID=50429 RepID=UPI000C043736
PPVFSKELGDISIREGETAFFEVFLENNTNCQIHWLKNGVELIENQRLKVESHDHGRYLLFIGDITDHDSGEYSCVAENEAGTAISTGTISIQRSSLLKSGETDEDEEEEMDSSIEIPVFKKELHDITANEHDTVTLEVIVDGDSPYELEWFKNAVEIMENDRISVVKHEDGRFTLNIRECEDDDTGEYCCVAQNEAGRVTCAGWLTVEIESILSEDDEETESEDEDEFVTKEFVTIRAGDVQKFYCIEEEVG